MTKKKHISHKPKSVRAAKQHIRANRRLHQRALLHPMMLFGLLITGVILLSVTIRTGADDLAVTARIEAPLLTTAATLDSPAANTKFTSKPITVGGTCPDESYVELYRNGMFSGVAVCNGGLYSIETDLFLGSNSLKVQAYNQTDTAGPDTPAITVVYTPPAPPAGKPSAPPARPSIPFTPPASPDAPIDTPVPNAPLLLWADYRFHVVSAGEQFVWKLRLQYGKNPYKVLIRWGDTQISRYDIPAATDFEIQHTYRRSGAYPVTVEATDSGFNTTTMQLLAMVKMPGTPGTISNILTDPSTPTGPATPSRNTLWFAWSALGFVAVMIVSFWLGERRQYLLLTTHAPKLWHGHGHR